MTPITHEIRGRRRADTSWSVEPTRVGPYRLCLELASGGMATVYLAHVGGSGASSRFAAVKVIHPHLAGDGEFAEMFVDEAEIASRIRHPNVCDVYEYEVGGGDGAAYLAMEYLLGESMSELQRKLSRARSRDADRDARFVCRALADACEGLHAAHELTDADGDPLEVVHRDVSPGNIMLSFDGVTKVVDFGVAAAARKRHRTETGMLKGKFAYIAPECLRGRKADRRSDVWGIGVMAWELVTKQRLFRRDSDVDTLRAVMDEPVRPPSEVAPELPEALDAIIMRALERDPEQRYATARELGRDLARFASDGEVITSADLAEWLEELFPGAREKRLHELDLAAQLAVGGALRAEAVAPRVRPTSPARDGRHDEARTRASAPEGDGDVESTRLYERTPWEGHPSPFAPSAAAREPTLRIPGLRASGWTLAAALVVGLSIGGLAVHLSSGAPSMAEAQTPAPAGVPGVHAPAEVASTSASPSSPPELRLQPGAGLARGPYVLELVESGQDELVLRIRLDDAHERRGAAPEGSPSETPRTPEPDAPASNATVQNGTVQNGTVQNGTRSDVGTAARARAAASADPPASPRPRYLRESPF